MAVKRKSKAKRKPGKRKSAKRNPSRKRKVLHGAAKTAHAKKLASGRRKRSAKKNPARKRKASSRKRSASPRKKSARKTVVRITQLNPKRKRKVSRKRTAAKRNPSHAEWGTLKNKVVSIDSRLHKVEKKQTKFDHALSGLSRMGQLASGR
jgi:hypothetical protein